MASNGIKKVIWRDLKGTPAKVHREKGILILDPAVWAKLPKEHKVFILFHEHAHTLGVKDELKADKIAWNLYRMRGYPINKGISALRDVLKNKGNEAKMRRYAQTLRAFKEKGYSKLVNYKLKNNPKLRDYV